MRHLIPSLFTLALAWAAPALAQTYPTKPIQFVVTAGPGSAADIVARIVGDEMGKLLGQRGCR